jgi:hypothetical protein
MRAKRIVLVAVIAATLAIGGGAATALASTSPSLTSDRLGAAAAPNPNDPSITKLNSLRGTQTSAQIATILVSSSMAQPVEALYDPVTMQYLAAYAATPTFSPLAIG